MNVAEVEMLTRTLPLFKVRMGSLDPSMSPVCSNEQSPQSEIINFSGYKRGISE